MKKQITTKKIITSANIKKYLKNSDLSDIIVWLLSIPKDELSDSMMEVYNKMTEKKQNEMWFAMFLEENLREELIELIEWNKNFN